MLSLTDAYDAITLVTFYACARVGPDFVDAHSQSRAAVRVSELTFVNVCNQIHCRQDEIHGKTLLNEDL